MTASSAQWVREIQVIETRFAEFENEMAKISRKAAKMDRMPLIWNVVDVSYVEVQVEKTIQKLRSFRVEIFGEDCRIDGYRPLATVEMASEDGSRAVIEGYTTREGDVALVEKYDHLIRARAGQCDHCNENRRRKYSVVLINDAEDLKIVGRTCINDFCKNSFDMLSYLAWLKRTVDELSGWTIPKDCYTPTFEFLTAIACVARVHGGFVSQRKADQIGGTPTMNYFHSLFTFGDVRPLTQCPAEYRPTTEDQDTARKVMAFVDALELEEGKGIYTYQKNLKDLMAGVTAFPSKKAALVASAVGYYNGHIERETKQAEAVAARAAAAPAAQTQTPNSQHIGVIGQRLKHVAVKFLSKKYLGEGDFGSRYLYRLVTVGGDVVNYFTTARIDMKSDPIYIVSFTVKKHDNYRGVNQTVVGRMTNHGEMK